MSYVLGETKAGNKVGWNISVQGVTNCRAPPCILLGWYILLSTKLLEAWTQRKDTSVRNHLEYPVGGNNFP